MPFRVCVTLIASSLIAACSDPQPHRAATIDAAAPGRIEADVRFLADDLLEGREAGTRGYDLAALYVASQFRKLGLAPAANDGFLQPVPLLKLLLKVARLLVRWSTR